MAIYYTQTSDKTSLWDMKIVKFPEGEGGMFALDKTGTWINPLLARKNGVANGEFLSGIWVSGMISSAGIFYFYPKPGGPNNTYSHIVGYHANAGYIDEENSPLAENYNVNNIVPENINVLIATDQVKNFRTDGIAKLEGWGIPADNIRIYLGTSMFGARIDGCVGVPIKKDK